jgi:DNA-binding protein Alba
MDTVFIGKKPLHSYFLIAQTALNENKTVTISARGAHIPRCIALVHKLKTLYANTTLTEATSIITLQDKVTNEPRPVPVYQATLKLP